MNINLDRLKKGLECCKIDDCDECPYLNNAHCVFHMAKECLEVIRIAEEAGVSFGGDKFEQYEIRRPTLIGNPPTPDYYKYNFDLVKWADDYSHCWSIAHLKWDKSENWFEFASVGLRYLNDRVDGLEDWITGWCEKKATELRNEDQPQ